MGNTESKSQRNLISKLWNAKVDLDVHDTIWSTISKTATEAIPPDTLKYFKMDYQLSKDVFKEALSDAVKCMPLSNNLMVITGCWHLVRYQLDNGDITGMLVPLLGDKLHRLKVDGRNEPELSESKLESLLQKAINTREQGEYWAHVTDRASKSVASMYAEGNQKEEKEESTQPQATASTHALIRLCMRLYGDPTEDRARARVNAERDKLTEDLLNRYDRAQQVWEEEDISFWYDEQDNIMYVVGEDNTIVTLYVMDYGFTKDINRHIVKEQLKVMKGAYDEWSNAVIDNEERRQQTNSTIQDLNDEIKSLELKLQTLRAEVTEHKATLGKYERKEEEYKHGYFKEFNKLFAKWEK